MTEAEWLAGSDLDPVLMVTDLRVQFGVTRTKAGRRKLRLFGCACCRRVAHLFPDEAGWVVVDLVERFADGDATQAEVDAALRDAKPALRDGEEDRVRQARLNLHEAIRKLCGTAAGAAIACSSVGIALRWLDAGEGSECAVQVNLLRDLFGNPFRPSPPLPLAVLAWSDSTVRRLAEGIYEERAFKRLPILADALVDAGCEQEELIGHFRSEEKHVRGCWGVDLILEKS